jgi:hypothetical protein
MRADEGEETLFWTDITRQGCAGHYSKCGSNTSAYEFVEKSFRIHATPFDGNCVALYVMRGTEYFIYKTMKCKERLPMVCIGEVLVEGSLAMNIQQMPRNDETEFGFIDRDKYFECAPDVILWNLRFFCIVFHF